jgi:DNA repair protein RadC
MELGRRRQMSEGLDRATITQSKEAIPIIMPLLQDLNYEVFCVLYLNHSGKLLRHELLSSGGLTATVADVRIILKNALLYNASRLIIAHNHPSGNRTPSQADISLTRQVKQAAALMDITLLDHIIIAGHSYVSLADDGLM